LPTIVCECGWSESKVKLIEDMRIWLVGGKPTVKLVFIVKFTRLTKNRISGYVETYERDENHVPQLVQKEVRLYTQYFIYFYLMAFRQYSQRPRQHN
jgi:hypothetical protein